MAITRRQFVKSGLAAGSVLALPRIASAGVRGANEEILVGIVGLGGRGTGAHLPSFQKQQGVTVAALCDPDQKRLGRAAETVASKYGTRPNSTPTCGRCSNGGTST